MFIWVYLQNTLCIFINLGKEIIGWCSLANDTNAAVHIFFPKAKVVDTLTFDSTSIDCTRVPSSDMEKFTLQYLDPEDQANQFRTYDEVNFITLYFAMKYMHCKNIRRFCGKITCNQLPVFFPLFFFFTGARKHFQESGTER